MKKGTFIHQEKYTKDILKKFKMDECKPIKTPMETNGHLDLDVDGKPVDQSLYRSMIGSLLYLTASRPDIMFSVCLCARFQANPKESHLSAVNKISWDTRTRILPKAVWIARVPPGVATCLGVL